MPSDLVINCRPDGMLQFIWSDSLASLAQQGKTGIRRVSDVEPDEQGQWWADMARVGGPKLGPFVLREEALQVELAWLRENR